MKIIVQIEEEQPDTFLLISGGLLKGDLITIQRMYAARTFWGSVVSTRRFRARILERVPLGRWYVYEVEYVEDVG